MMVKTTGFAILGNGVAAQYHRRAISANLQLGARLVAVGHHDPARFAEIGERAGVPCVSVERVLADPAVNVVCICTPSGLHAQQAIAAARAGKNVLVEKPMALTLEDADAMIHACREAGVLLAVAFQRRGVPLFQQVQRAVRLGDLGERTLGVVTLPYYRSQSYYDQAAWRGTWALDGGGVLMNQGIHLIDLLVWFMGDPVAVQAQASTAHHRIEVEDLLAAVLHFPGGAMATVTATTAAGSGFPHRLEVYGTQGGIQIEGESLVRWKLTEPARASMAPPASSTTTGPGPGGDPTGISPSGHVALVRDMILALEQSRPPLVDGAEGRRSLAAVLAIYRAAGLPSTQDGGEHGGQA